MNTNDPFARRIASSLHNLRNGAFGWMDANQKAQESRSRISAADSSFFDAQLKASSTTWDNGERDVSSEGSQLVDSFQNGSEVVNGMGTDLASARQLMHTAGATIHRETLSLPQLRNELREANDPRAQAVDRALNPLNESHHFALSADGNWESAQGTVGSVQGQVEHAIGEAEEVAADEPGRDVSFSGQSAMNDARSIQLELTNANTALGRGETNTKIGTDRIEKAMLALSEGLGLSLDEVFEKYPSNPLA